MTHTKAIFYRDGCVLWAYHRGVVPMQIRLAHYSMRTHTEEVKGTFVKAFPYELICSRDTREQTVILLTEELVDLQVVWLPDVFCILFSYFFLLHLCNIWLHSRPTGPQDSSSDSPVIPVNQEMPFSFLVLTTFVALKTLICSVSLGLTEM